MKFIDEIDIHVRGGNGGNGCVAFRRERYRPKGGPSGGNGGRGGDVILEATSQLSSLLEMRYHPRWKAGNGTHGQGNDRYGRSGKDVVIRLPVGTVVTDTESGAQLADLDADGMQVVVAKGGKGGRGNMHFATSTRQTPDFAEEGRKGEERVLHLELKLLADVGVIGFPNVGKSTLIRRVSAARPRVADYPFTTLVPTLGVVRLDDVREMVLADMPGLIQGASDGVGLGIRFLKHVERTRVLCHVITVGREEGTRPLSDLEAIDAELAGFDPDLAARPQVIALNKMDLTHVREEAQRTVAEIEKNGRGPVVVISAATGEGIDELLEALWSTLHPSDD